MIIKSISHTNNRASIKNLMAYVFGDKNMSNDLGESVTISNLLRGKQDSWAKQFERIEARRTSFYGGKEVRLYHEILSFSPDSKPTKKELEDLIWKYLELRLDAPTLAFGAVHFSKSHCHAHVVIQGIDTYGKSIRKSKISFKEDVQISLNLYQQKQYPNLSDSIIDYSKSSKNKIKLESHNSMQRSKQKNEKSHKQHLDEILKTVFVDANSVEAFIGELAMKNIEVYYRSEKLTGLIFHKRKYRLVKTLGVDFEKLLQPTLKNQRLERLKRINERNREDNKNKER